MLEWVEHRKEQYYSQVTVLQEKEFARNTNFGKYMDQSSETHRQNLFCYWGKCCHRWNSGTQLQAPPTDNGVSTMTVTFNSSLRSLETQLKATPTALGTLRSTANTIVDTVAAANNSYQSTQYSNQESLYETQIMPNVLASQQWKTTTLPPKVSDAATTDIGLVSRATTKRDILPTELGEEATAN